MLDTSVVVATDVLELPDEVAISTATLAELHFGIHLARTEAERRVRLQRLGEVEATFAALPVDASVARAYGALAQAVSSTERQSRRRVVDLLIAATASVHGATLYTRDEGFAGMASEVDVRVV